MQEEYPLNDCYQILELCQHASYQDARKSYLTLIQRWHPDRFEKYPPLQAHAVRVTQDINAAFEVLSQILPHNQSISDKLFCDSFETGASDWSAYYTAATQENQQNSETVPVSEIERSLNTMVPVKQPVRSIVNVLLSPFKCVTDLSVYLIVERPTVPLVAGVVFMATWY